MRLRHVASVLLMAAFGQGVVQADGSDRVGASWVVLLDGERLTVHLDKAPLRRVLSELARQGGFRVQLSERRDAPVVSAHFERLPLDEAVERLLSGWSYAVLYAASPLEQGRSARRITEVLVLDRAGSPNEGVRDSRAPDSTVVLANPGPQERIEALERWITARDGSSGVDPLTHAMVDPDELVRARAEQLLEDLWSGDSRQ